MNILVHSCDEFYISYNPKISALAKALDGFVAVFTGGEVKDLPETALVDIRTGHNFYILYGDHSEAYRKLVPDWQACYDYFLDHLEQIGHTSDVPYSTVN